MSGSYYAEDCTVKKVIALVIVLGLPLVASPVGAESGLSKVKCEGIKKH